MSTFELNVSSTEIVETPLQYRLFMYEMFFDVITQIKILEPVYSIYTVRVFVTCHLFPPPKYLYVADPMQWMCLHLIT